MLNISIWYQLLKAIFNPCKNLPSIVALCLLRYELHLQQFNYEIIVYCAAKNHQNVDFLSRKPSQTNQPVYEDTSEYLYTAAVQQLGCSNNSTRTITAKELRKETVEDKELSKLLSDLKTGECQNPELSINDGIIFWLPFIGMEEMMEKIVTFMRE